MRWGPSTSPWTTPSSARCSARPLAAYQVVGHRLAECHLIVEGIRALALKAAWSADPFDAAQAATYAQMNFQKVLFDTHQFNGGMGVTNEHKLHFWTYRFRALQSEVGGAASAASLETADLLWGPVTSRERQGMTALALRDAPDPRRALCRK